MKPSDGTPWGVWRRNVDWPCTMMAQQPIACSKAGANPGTFVACYMALHQRNPCDVTKQQISRYKLVNPAACGR